MAHHIQNGDEVTCLALTQGLRVHDVVLVEKFRTGAKAADVEDLDALVEERERIKRQEVADACACFGITDVRFLSYSDKVLVPNEEMIDKVARVIRDVRPHVVVTHYPYVWGGYKPSTSFDCSGFVSYVYNQCGWDFGRLGAQGLYNISRRTSSPRPGDLVFFTGTYDTPGVSHVGIYVGDGWMLHCGDPIGYANLNTSYWQSHFYAYGRLS